MAKTITKATIDTIFPTSVSSLKAGWLVDVGGTLLVASWLV